MKNLIITNKRQILISKLIVMWFFGINLDSDK